MAEIIAISGETIILDDADLDDLAQHRWFIQRTKRANTTYAMARITMPDGKRITKGIHRIIMGDPAGMQIDHINGNGLDNRRTNLRIVTRQQNLQNQKSRGGASPYRGVSASAEKWMACLTHNYQRIYLGTFTTDVEAAQAYDAKARELFGEYAALNFPAGDERAA